MGRRKKEDCIMCGKSARDLSGWDDERYISFPETKYILCFQCFEKIAMQRWDYHPPKIEYIQPKITNKKKKIDHEIRKEVYERDKYRCVYCGDHKNLTLDHVYPESLGGEATVENLATSCASCNSKKGIKVID